MKPAVCLAILFAWIAIPAGALRAQDGTAVCQGLSVSLSQGRSEAYDPREQSPLRLPVQIRVGAVPEGCERPRIRFLPTTGGQLDFAGPGGRLNGRFARRTGDLRRDGNTARLTRPATERLLRTGSLEIDLAEILRGQYEAPGVYRKDVSVEIDGVLRGVFDLDVTVRPVIAFARGTSSRPVALDFAELEPGERVRTSFFFRSNATVEVTAISQNGGVLTNEANPALSPIPYEMALNGRSVALTAPATLTVENRPGRQVFTGNLELTIGSFDRAWAGDYGDVLTLELRAF